MQMQETEARDSDLGSNETNPIIAIKSIPGAASIGLIP